MPGWEKTENEIRFRLHDPGLYSTCRSKELTDGVRVIYCKRKDSEEWEAQALRFSREKFDMESAKTWYEKHKDGFKESITPDEKMLASKNIMPDEELTRFTESLEILSHDTGATWFVTPLKFGKSSTPPYYVYTKESVAGSIHVFDGAVVYINSIADRGGHKTNGDEKVTRDMIGYLSRPEVHNDRLTASLTILPSASWFKDNLLFLEGKKKLNFYKLSIDAYGAAELRDYQGEQLPHAKNFVQVDVDVVQRGAAGGEFNHLIESIKQPNGHYFSGANTMNKIKQRLLALFAIIAPTFLESKNIDWLKVNENELFTHLLEADKAQSRMELPDGFKIEADDAPKILDDEIKKLTESKPAEPVKPDPPTKKGAANPDDLSKFTESQQKMQKQIEDLNKSNCSHMLASSLATCDLPEPIKDSIKKTFEGRIFTESELNDHVKAQRDMFAKLFPGNVTRVVAGQDQFDKVKAGLLGLFLEGSVKRPTPDERKILTGDTPPLRSFKEGYIMLTGDDKLTGDKPRDRRFSESITTADWDQVAADVMHTALLREMQLLNLETWRDFAKIVPLSDFRTVHRVRYGGYGALPTVTEKGPYAPLTSPTDEEATYAPTKKGGTEEITLEMIRNDNVGAIQDIPQKLARAAAYGLYYTIYYTMLRPQGAYTIYDTVTLYHASHPIATGVTHSNTGTTAIATGLAAGRTLMRKFPEKDSNIGIGIRTGFVLVPPDLEDTAYGLCTTAYGVYNQVPTALQSQGIKVIVVDLWSDATDYALVANPADRRGLEVGFLDGKETPELFVSNIPNTGSWFTNDSATFKIRYIWGIVITDWRTFYGQTVA